MTTLKVIEKFILVPNGCDVSVGPFDAIVRLDVTTPVPENQASHCPCFTMPMPDEQSDEWLVNVGYVCEILTVLVGRSSRILIVGPSSANVAAAWLLKNTRMNLGDLAAILHDVPGYSSGGALAALEASIPGKRLVMAERVQPPRAYRPMLPPSSPPGQVQATPPVQAQFVSAVPPPQSGMNIQPIVGAQPGQMPGRMAVPDDQRIDSLLSMLPGHRPELHGSSGPRPVPPEGAELVDVVLADSQDRLIRAADGVSGSDSGDGKSG